MIFFKKREKLTGMGKEETNALQKKMRVLNYMPVRYGFLSTWLSFLDSAEDIMRKKLKNISIDSLNAGAPTSNFVCMFDPWVDSMATQSYANAKEQYANHMNLIQHQKGILEGEITKTQLQIDELEADLTDIEEKLSYYKAIEKRRRI